MYREIKFRQGGIKEIENCPAEVDIARVKREGEIDKYR